MCGGPDVRLGAHASGIGRSLLMSLPRCRSASGIAAARSWWSGLAGSGLCEELVRCRAGPVQRWAPGGSLKPVCPQTHVRPSPSCRGPTTKSNTDQNTPKHTHIHTHATATYDLTTPAFAPYQLTRPPLPLRLHTM